MTTSRQNPPNTELQEAPDFSLMLGGPLYQLWRRARLSGNALELLHRRTLVLVAITWVPLLLLSILAGQAWPGRVELAFLFDLEMHVRLLVALPLLLAAELIVHRWTRSGIAQFLTHGLIPATARQQFDDAIASSMRLRNSITAELLLLLLVCTVGIGYLWQFNVSHDIASWYGSGSGDAPSLSAAGYWARFVSLPIFQFLSIRWFYRLFIWGRLLFKISRINLRLLPAHPDRCGGIGFLSTISQGFAPIMLAQSAMVAGVIADQILFAGARLTEFSLEIFGIVGLMMALIFGPLLFFGPGMARAKLNGLHEYSALAQRYVREFNDKWLGAKQPDEPLVGSADIQSLADMGGSFEIIEGMRWAPITWRSMGQLVGITLLPLAPLLLTMFPMEELLKRFVGALF